MNNRQHGPEAPAPQARADRTGERRSPDSSVPPSFDANLLTSSALLSLQRLAGNSAIAGLLTANGGRRSAGAPPVQREPAVVPPPATSKPAKAIASQHRASAAEMIAKQYPHLAGVLRPDQVAQVQRVLDARVKVGEINQQMQAVPNYWSSDKGYGGTTEAVDRMKQLEARRSYYASLADQHTHPISVPSKPLLADDILPKKAEPRKEVLRPDQKPSPTMVKQVEHELDEAMAKAGVKRAEPEAVDAFRNNLYAELTSYPVNLTIAEGLQPNPLFIFDCGPYRIGNSGGLITFGSLLADDSISWPYMTVLHDQINKLQFQMVELQLMMRGKLYDQRGKKVGERSGWAGGLGDVRVGWEVGHIAGHPDSDVGHTEMQLAMMKHPGAKIIFKAPDGWLHAFDLEPKDGLSSLKDLFKPIDEDFSYILDNGCEVVEPWKVITTDGVILERAKSPKKDHSGWRRPTAFDATDRMDQFAMGAIFGDFVDDPSGATIMGNMLISMIPVVGTAAAARDVGHGIGVIWKTRGRDGKLTTLLNLVALIPILGGIFRAGVRSAEKGAAKGSKVVAEALEKDSAKVQEELLAKLEHDLPAVEKAFPDALKLGREASGLKSETKLLEDALKGSKGAADQFAIKAAAHLKILDGDVGAMVKLHGGKWADIMAVLKQAKDGEALGKEMAALREVQVKQALEQAFAQNAERMGKDIKPPRLEPTGSTSWTSDLDISIKGARASAWVMWSETYLARRFGAESFEEVNKLFNVSLFTESKRLHMFTEAGASAAQVGAIERALVKESEVNVLAKMLHEGSSEEKVLARAKTIIPDLAREKNPAASSLWQKVLNRRGEIEKLAKNDLARRQLALEIDGLAMQFERAATPAEKARIGMAMSEKQMLLNTLIHDAYATPGAGFKQITAREAGQNLALRRAMKPGMSAEMKYMAVLGELPMIEGVLRDLEKAGGAFTPETAKGLAKYSERLVITAGQLGGTDAAKVAAAKAGQAQQLFQNLQFLLMGKKDPILMATQAREALAQAAKDLNEVLDTLLAQAKSASGAGLTKLDREFAAKTAEVLSQEKALVVGANLEGQLSDVKATAPNPALAEPHPPSQAPAPTIHDGQQGKHIPGHNNFIPGRSELTHPDPQDLLKRFSGTGDPLQGVRGQPGFRERVDFHEKIGIYVDPVSGSRQTTTVGIIHYSGKGAHIVPARPKM